MGASPETASVHVTLAASYCTLSVAALERAPSVSFVPSGSGLDALGMASAEYTSGAAS